MSTHNIYNFMIKQESFRNIFLELSEEFRKDSKVSSK